jgi:hypothetical protein
MKKLTLGLFAASALCAAGLVATAMPAAANHRGNSDFTITLGNAQFGYNDGYYDHDRRWHRWHNRHERDWYQQNHGPSYYHMRRYRDRDHNRREWRNFRRDDWHEDGYRH